jgi:serine/threonine protein kinase
MSQRPQSSSFPLSGMPTPKPEGMIGEYVIVAELARGGMGCVYLARRRGQAGFERHFAIKVMNHNLSNDNDALLMLLDEAHIASRLHHPNVVSVLDIGTSDGGYYLVMDYVEGCSLQDLMMRNREARPPRRVVPIILEALNGLHAVHTLRNPAGELYGVVHRDVSPHNLLVGLDGGCRVTDFGIAKASERFTDTQAGVYKGKLAYMAPEQLKGSGDIDGRADIWSAGVTLYFALTHRHPFRGPNDAATLHNILSAEIPPPSQVGLRPPSCLDAVVLKALAREREDRFESAQAFGEALRRVALDNDLLGAPSEVATWVEDTFGKELTERRRRIRSVSAGDAEPMTVSGKVPVVPRLWSAQDAANDAVRAAGDDLSSSRENAIGAPTTRSLRSKVLALAVVMGVAFGAGALAVDWLDRRAKSVEASIRARVLEDRTAATRATSAVRTTLTAAAVPEPAPIISREAPTTATSAEPSTMNEARRRQVAARRAASMDDAPASERARPSAETAPAATPQPPAQPTPPEPRRAMERNPYLSGE